MIHKFVFDKKKVYTLPKVFPIGEEAKMEEAEMFQVSIRSCTCFFIVLQLV